MVIFYSIIIPALLIVIIADMRQKLNGSNNKTSR